jgi:hypothetical protein
MNQKEYQNLAAEQPKGVKQEPEALLNLAQCAHHMTNQLHPIWFRLPKTVLP